MPQPAILLEGLGKRYRIGGKRQRYYSLRESAIVAARRLLCSLRGRASPRLEDFWALKDISLSIQPGEVVGVIGLNGAGKSTLLKILSEVTEPTEGRAVLRGRVGSLLEVGTGFHPELTGRENIYLSGAILGMRKSEIDRKFDEIVGFAGTEKFLDTPCKHYSGGMYVRLGFAVAAHLEPEILLVDEVLAVGDMEFQKRCLGKMNEVARSGRTIVFVSHSMPTVQALCQTCILLAGGRLSACGATDTVIDRYLNLVHGIGSGLVLEGRTTSRVKTSDFHFRRATINNARTGEPVKALMAGMPVDVEIACCYGGRYGPVLDDVIISLGFSSCGGQRLMVCRSDSVGKVFSMRPGLNTVRCRIPKWPLGRGQYTVEIRATKANGKLDMITGLGPVESEPGDFFGTGKLGASGQEAFFADFAWEAAP